MNNILKEKIYNLCYQVKTGKPAASMPIQKRYSNQAKQITLKECRLKCHIEPLSEGWINFWIFKKDYMLEVIKGLPSKPKTTFDHWVLGKAFGYSDEAIDEFLSSPEASSVASRTGR